MLASGILGAGQGSFDLGSSLKAPANSAVVDPPSEHELVLVLDARVDEVEEHPPLDAIGRRVRNERGTVRQPAANQPVRVVAAAGPPLAGDGLAPGVDPPDVSADGTVDPLRIPRAVRMHILEVVPLFGR